MKSYKPGRNRLNPALKKELGVRWKLSFWLPLRRWRWLIQAFKRKAARIFRQSGRLLLPFTNCPMRNADIRKAPSVPPCLSPVLSRRPAVLGLHYLSLLVSSRLGRTRACIWKRKWWVCPGILESSCSAVAWPVPWCCPAGCALLARWSPEFWNCVQSSGRTPDPVRFCPREATSSRAPGVSRPWDVHLITYSSAGRLVTQSPGWCEGMWAVRAVARLPLQVYLGCFRFFSVVTYLNYILFSTAVQ